MILDFSPAIHWIDETTRKSTPKYQTSGAIDHEKIIKIPSIKMRPIMKAPA
jgi:hypothetical protein